MRRVVVTTAANRKSGLGADRGGFADERVLSPCTDPHTGTGARRVVVS
jgi:hypothetical protein